MKQLSIITATFLLLFITSNSATALDSVTLQLKWTHAFQFAGYYTAKEKGYYRDAGLDVTLTEAGPGIDVVKQVLNGTAQFGVGTSSLLLERHTGKPVVALAVIFQHSPQVLITHNNKLKHGIKSIEGKRLMLEPHGDELLAFLKKKSVELKQVVRLEHSFDPKDLINNRVDAMSAYITYETWFLDQAGLSYNIYSPRSAGIDFYGDNLFTSEELLKQDPDLVERFRSASLKGWRYAMANQDEVSAMIHNSYSSKLPTEFYRYEAGRMTDLMLPRMIEIGYMSEDRWKHIADTYAELGLLPNDISLKGFIYKKKPDIDYTKIYIILTIVLAVVLGIITTFHNINRRLFKSEERFSLAMRGANDGLWDWNLETDEVYYSPRWKSMLGYKESELDNNIDTWKNLIHPDDKDWVIEKAQDCTSGHTNSFEAEIRMLHKDGHEVFILSRAFLVNHKPGDKPDRLVGTHVDISERKKVEFFNKRNADILEMIAVGQPAPNIYDAIALMYEGLHPGMRCSMLELHDNKLIHGGAPSLPKEYCDAVNGLVYGPNVGSCGTSTYTGELVIVENIETDPKWDVIKHVALPHGMRSCWSEPIKSSSGKVLGAFGMYYNHPALPNPLELNDLKSAARLASIIMEREESEKELQAERSALEKANQAKSVFLATMSHEIRTPLNTIIGMGEMLSETVNTPQQKRYVSAQIKSSEGLLSLINDILDLSKIEAGQMTLESIPFNLTELVDGTTQILSVQAQDKGLVLEQTIDRNVPSQIIGDPQRLRQILLNLLSNAIKFSEYGKIQLKVSMTAAGHHLFSVFDNGVGISHESQKEIFKPFTQADSSVTRQYGGTGLGLTICSQLIESMQGKIWVESQLGDGSTFFFSIPFKQIIDQEDLEIAHASTAQHKKPDLSPPTSKVVNLVLLAEDVVENQYVLQAFLKGSSYQLEITNNGAEALDKFKNGDYKIVLMDIQMPVMDGYTATKKIREWEDKIGSDRTPIVALTANAMTEDRARTLEAGCDLHIAKPIRKKRLFEVLDQFVMNS
ncbi:MAG: ABC transporter substrate-binding protein [Magnetococcales bacterium]|nr:ABC transporter substrate-binding protein [Magnetococcales bacterium]